MSRFKGIETYTLDNKGRVNIPAKMRKTLSPEANDTFVLTRGFEKCIYAYPLDEWKKKEEQLEQLNEYQEKNRFFMRMLLQYSEDVKMDAQLRVAIPKELLDFAGIEKKVTIAGVMNHIEFWNPEEYDSYMSGHPESYEEVAEKLSTGKVQQ
ncbi:division/cell wall cluster transcriptional repressor MraZ [Bacteroidetes/Chlorobi group bacterium ChocPot_Mid]|jgi:MraZ protein|nr:MAG: division/cell wall cluster transcriptional repressor MraZ [Bacteroidetes/Chlorobi group bacterium ChocPot_Mid]